MLKNIAVEADNDVLIQLDLSQVDIINFPHARIFWNVYDQQYGSPIAGSPPVISKSVDGATIILIDSPTHKAIIELSAVDTVNLLRNYYHEATLVDFSGNISTLENGIFTVLPTENRP
jgi:hypothetical protein